MAKKKETEQSGEQLELIDVTPKNAKPIIEVGRLYNIAKKARIASLAEEVKYKTKIRQMVKDAGIQRLEDGTIKFTHNRVTILVEPQDEKVTVKENTESE